MAFLPRSGELIIRLLKVRAWARERNDAYDSERGAWSHEVSTSPFSVFYIKRLEAGYLKRKETHLDHNCGHW